MTDVMLTFANVSPGRADPERAPAVAGPDRVLAGRCLRVADDLDGWPQCPSYELLTIHEIEPGKLAGVAEWLSDGSAADGDREFWLWEAVTPRVAVPDAGDGPFDQMLVLTNPTAGMESEFNRWYDEVHVPDILQKIGGFVAGRRFRRVAVSANGDCRWSYMALYDIPKGQMEYCFSRLTWSRAEREQALAAGREPQVAIAPAMGDDRALWMYRETT